MSTQGPKCWKCGNSKKECRCTFLEKAKKKSPGQSRAKPKAESKKAEVDK